MREYRLFCLNDLGSLDFVETIMAADDRAAIREARHLKRRARKCEVWEGRRLVATLAADDLAACALDQPSRPKALHRQVASREPAR